jgi:hypothetical protein
MQYKTAQNPVMITSMVDGAPKRNELDGRPTVSSRHFFWSTVAVCPSPHERISLDDTVVDSVRRGRRDFSMV